MPRDDEGDYEVGYGKPPHQTRFKKGQSGNPRGRPSGSKNLNTLLTDALNEPVIVTDDGGRRKISKREAIVTQLVNRSANADLRAVKIVLEMLRDIEGQSEVAPPETSASTAVDEKVMEQLRARFSKAKADDREPDPS